uniref:(northern house mosquito) hypothetical protein n=1 Tax=Culex pipiens TaxID=7175 RepID=A0A8D8AJ08_CULPI
METRNGKWWRTSLTKGRGAGRRVKLIGVSELAKHRSRTLLELLHMSFSWLRFAVEYSSRSLCFNSLVGVRAKFGISLFVGVRVQRMAGKLKSPSTIRLSFAFILETIHVKECLC